ncbi:hypothetical protein CDAR_70831 [Caerostris darwini]|uniref:Uncharacterized protein n=1 Tax=Caerostris darwini TaxID=1538125 RepID=A0AAV4WH96_9ARAC|nr:hypothetical protein CDAR_70831 [Caerostris darwini]
MGHISVISMKHFSVVRHSNRSSNVSGQACDIRIKASKGASPESVTNRLLFFAFAANGKNAGKRENRQTNPMKQSSQPIKRTDRDRSDERLRSLASTLSMTVKWI